MSSADTLSSPADTAPGIRAIDPVRTAIMNNRFVAIVEEASAILQRTAFTTFVKLVQDYQCAIADAEGEVFAYPRQTGVSAFMGLPLWGILRHFPKDSWQPGDIVITNDPFTSDGVVTHMMDVTMIRPIFADGVLVAFSWAFVHASDIGGAVPGSISPAFRETFQEGVRVRPMKLYKAGVLDEEIRDIFLMNSRIPGEMWGDFQAMIAALQSMDRRLNELCGRYGRAAVTGAMEDVMALSERKARAVLAALPDGQYAFADYVEGFEPGAFTHIHTTMTVKGDEVELNLDGTDPQIPAAYNFVCGERTHPYAVQALLYHIITQAPDIARNGGVLRPLRMRAPRGTIVNAEFPAAGGSRVAASSRVDDTILGCLNQILPGGIAAAGPGMVGIIVVNARDPRTGRARVGVVNPICGGGGARAGLDGIDGVDVRFGNLKTVPVELMEIETVMRMKSLRLLPDSQAAGQFRSGAAVEMQLENTADEATMTVRGLNRFHFRPWGLRGGEAGRLGAVTLNPDTASAREIGKIDVLPLAAGDVVRIVTPAGGGYGDPFARAPQAVAADVAQGLLSAARAAAVYGVALDAAGGVDAAATASLRAARVPGSGAAFTCGPERDGYDAIWPMPVRAELARRAMAEPASSRHALLSAVRSRLTAAGQEVTGEILASTLEAEAARLGLRRAP